MSYFSRHELFFSFFFAVFSSISMRHCPTVRLSELLNEKREEKVMQNVFLQTDQKATCHIIHISILVFEFPFPLVHCYLRGPFWALIPCYTKYTDYKTYCNSNIAYSLLSNL